ncbi:MAG: LysM peptidoglycan-binding domain-containing protein [Desulfovibrio sp.]|nr:LysM peptidoglycan-binding domain-containing protein [Desulfovibrio sp.]
MKAKTALAAGCILLMTTGPAFSGVRILPVGAPFPTIVIEQPKQEYVVKSGDTVAAIAKKFSVTPAALMSENNIKDAKKLKVGQKLAISVPAKPLGAAAPGKPAPAGAGKPAPAAEVPTAGQAKPFVPEGKAAKSPAGKPEAATAAVQPAPGATPTVTPQTATARHAGKTGIIENDTDVPRAIREESQAYAKKWLDMSDELAVGTETNKKIRQIGGKWECSYRVMLKDTMASEVKRVHYDHTPYVGHITYRIISYRCEAPTKEAALKGPFEAKEESVREIFSYSGQKKAWR